MAALDLNTIYHTSYGWDLLCSALVEHERLLWELEYLAKEAPMDGSPEITDRLNLVRAQVLLFERLMIGQRVDSLVILVKHYAEIVSRPRGEMAKRVA